jgi:hypothetical protein
MGCEFSTEQNKWSTSRRDVFRGIYGEYLDKVKRAADAQLIAF